MMEFDTDGDSLSRAATSARSATTTQEGRILLSVQDGEARLTGSSGTFQVGSGFPARNAVDGACTLGAEDLQQIARALAKNGTVSLKLADEKVSISSGRARFSIPVIDGKDFPATSVEIPDQRAVEIPSGVLSQALDALMPALAPDSMQHENLKGVHLKIVDEGLRLTGSDGTRLHIAMIDALPVLPDEGIILPQKAAREIARIGQKRVVRLWASDKQVYAAAGSEHVFASLVDAAYPVIDALLAIPERSFLIPRTTLIDAVTRVRAILDRQERQPILRLEVANQQMVLRATGDQKQAEEALAVDGDGTLTIGLNATFLHDALRNFQSEVIAFHYSAGDKLVLLRDPDMPAGEGPTVVIMPARI